MKGWVTDSEQACNWCDTPSNRPAASKNRNSSLVDHFFEETPQASHEPTDSIQFNREENSPQFSIGKIPQGEKEAQSAEVQIKFLKRSRNDESAIQKINMVSFNFDSKKAVN